MNNRKSSFWILWPQLSKAWWFFRRFRYGESIPKSENIANTDVGYDIEGTEL